MTGRVFHRSQGEGLTATVWRYCSICRIQLRRKLDVFLAFEPTKYCASSSRYATLTRTGLACRRIAGSTSRFVNFHSYHQAPLKAQLHLKKLHQSVFFGSSIKENELFKFFEKLIDPYPDTKLESYPKAFFAFMWNCAKSVRRYVFLMAIGTAIIGAFEAILFSVLGKIVQQLSSTAPEKLWPESKVQIFFLILVLFFSCLLVAVHSLVKYQTLSGSFTMRMRWNFHRTLLIQDFPFFANEFPGRLSATVMQTALAVRVTWMIFADLLVFLTIYFCTIIGVAGALDYRLIIPFLVWLFLYVLVLVAIVPRLGAAGKRMAESRAIVHGQITDAYSNMLTVKIFSHSEQEKKSIKKSMTPFMRNTHEQLRFVSAFEVANHTLSMLLLGCTSGVTLILWRQGVVGIGAVAAATAMALRLSGIAQFVMGQMALLFENIGVIQDGINTLNAAKKNEEEVDKPTLSAPRGEIIFENVNFGYGDQNEVLQNFNLTIRAGEKIGIVGASGAGKSTLIGILLRLYDIRSGKILVDGQDIQLVTQDSLRSQFGVVTQETSLLHRSIGENISYGHRDALHSDIVEAARQAEADQFIDSLQDAEGRTGYDVMVGDRGIKLSGGQRQRVAIARAFLKDAPIVILDEATSALDSKIEFQIQSKITNLMAGKTVIAVAHRLSSIVNMDRIVVLDKGKIVESGSHKQLLDEGGLYARLWDLQSKSDSTAPVR